MANEAVIIELMGDPKGGAVTYNCLDANAITKGTLLVISGARTVSAQPTICSLKSFAGIAAQDKVASDGSTTISVYTKGIFDLKVDPVVAIIQGSYVIMSGGNLISNYGGTGAQLSGGYIVGKALETGAAGDVINVAVGMY